MGGELTSREREVLKLLGDGLSTRQMATLLSVSLATVRNHIQSILTKMDAHSRIEAVSMARTWNMAPAERVLKLLQREGWRLAEWQEDLIRKAFPPSPSIPLQRGPIITTAYARQV